MTNSRNTLRRAESDIAPVEVEVDVVITLPLSEYFDTHSPGKTKR